MALMEFEEELDEDEELEEKPKRILTEDDKDALQIRSLLAGELLKNPQVKKSLDEALNDLKDKNFLEDLLLITLQKRLVEWEESQSKPIGYEERLEKTDELIEEVGKQVSDLYKEKYDEILKIFLREGLSQEIKDEVTKIHRRIIQRRMDRNKIEELRKDIIYKNFIEPRNKKLVMEYEETLQKRNEEQNEKTMRNLIKLHNGIAEILWQADDINKFKASQVRYGLPQTLGYELEGIKIYSYFSFYQDPILKYSLTNQKNIFSSLFNIAYVKSNLIKWDYDKDTPIEDMKSGKAEPIKTTVLETKDICLGELFPYLENGESLKVVVYVRYVRTDGQSDVIDIGFKSTVSWVKIQVKQPSLKGVTPVTRNGQVFKLLFTVTKTEFPKTGRYEIYGRAWRPVKTPISMVK